MSNNNNNRNHDLSPDENRRRATPPPRTNPAESIFSTITQFINDLNPGNIQQIPSNSPDVLFSGVLGGNIPEFSVTVDRTNILPNGRPQESRPGSQGNDAGVVFNLGNIPNALRELVERSMQSTQQPAVRATEESIRHLKIMNPDDLPSDARKCAICYEDFEHPIDSGKSQINISERFEEVNDDPPVAFPKGPSTQTFTYYSKLNQSSTQEESKQRDTQPEHVPVQMPCKHVFGRSCLIEWLKQNVSCPLCRQEIEAEQNSTTTARSLIINKANVASHFSSQSDHLLDDPAIPIPINASNNNRTRSPFFGNQGFGGILNNLMAGAGSVSITNIVHNGGINQSTTTASSTNNIIPEANTDDAIEEDVNHDNS